MVAPKVQKIFNKMKKEIPKAFWTHWTHRDRYALTGLMSQLVGEGNKYDAEQYNKKLDEYEEKHKD